MVLGMNTYHHKIYGMLHKGNKIHGSTKYFYKDSQITV